MEVKAPPEKQQMQQMVAYEVIYQGGIHASAMAAYVPRDRCSQNVSIKFYLSYLSLP